MKSAPCWPGRWPAWQRSIGKCFILRDVDSMSIEETAEVLNISIASVKTRLLRARLMLRDILAPELADGWFSRTPFGKGSKPW